MSGYTPYPTKGRALLWAIIMGIAAAVGYLLAELFMAHDLSWVAWGMIGIFVFITLFSYILNVRRVPKKTL